jgi:hypothetical protein
MSAWRRQALTLLPEFRATLESSESPMAVWIELHLQFDRAMEAGDSSRVERLLAFAAWCASEQSGSLPNDTSTAAAVAFYEHLPQNREYWQHFPRWFPGSKFHDLLPVFSYHLSETEVTELKKAYATAARMSTKER